MYLFVTRNDFWFLAVNTIHHLLFSENLQRLIMLYELYSDISRLGTDVLVVWQHTVCYLDWLTVYLYSTPTLHLRTHSLMGCLRKLARRENKYFFVNNSPKIYFGALVLITFHWCIPKKENKMIVEVSLEVRMKV